MGLQVRKRTKGKDGWLNGSYSKRGPKASVSVKPASNVTYNSGNILGGKGHPSRLTANLGNGIRWVSYGSTKRGKKSTPMTAQDCILAAIVIAIVVSVFLLMQ
jgi:hypothetical protein